jgi:hypothetical protein
MNASELIRMLQQVDPTRPVILAKDAEGNDYSPLADVTFGRYQPQSSYSGELVSAWTDADDDQSHFVVILGPVN